MSPTVNSSMLSQSLRIKLGGSIAFANLKDPSTAFVAVSQQQVQSLKSMVAAMIRKSIDS